RHLQERWSRQRQSAQRNGGLVRRERVVAGGQDHRKGVLAKRRLDRRTRPNATMGAFAAPPNAVLDARTRPRPGIAELTDGDQSVLSALEVCKFAVERMHALPSLSGDEGSAAHATSRLGHHPFGALSTLTPVARSNRRAVDLPHRHVWKP